MVATTFIKQDSPGASGRFPGEVVACPGFTIWWLALTWLQHEIAKAILSLQKPGGGPTLIFHTALARAEQMLHYYKSVNCNFCTHRHTGGYTNATSNLSSAHQIYGGRCPSVTFTPHAKLGVLATVGHPPHTILRFIFITLRVQCTPHHPFQPHYCTPHEYRSALQQPPCRPLPHPSPHAPQRSFPFGRD